jgi:DNA-binding transcriptional ArsR family regulator
MNSRTALEILSRLAEGVDPHTGEVFPPESPYQQSDTVRALYRAVSELEGAARKEERQRRLPARAGEPWQQSEADEAVAGFEGGLSIEEIARKHQRTSAAIEAHLVKCGKISLEERRFAFRR